MFRPEYISPEDAFRDRIEPKQVREFLEDRFNGSPGPVKARIMAAELLADSVEFHSLVSMTERLKDLGSFVEHSARAKDFDPSKDIFVLTEYNGTSDSFVTHLYSRVNNIPPDRLYTREQFENLSGELKDRRIVSLDDQFYSGQQARMAMIEVGSTRRALGALGSYEYFARSMNGQEAPVEFITAQTDLSLNVNNGRIASHYSAEDKDVLTRLNGPSPHEVPFLDGLFSTIVFPHMTSDTTPRWLARFAHTFWKAGYPGMESVWDELTPPSPSAGSFSQGFSVVGDHFPPPMHSKGVSVGVHSRLPMHSKGVSVSDFHFPLHDFHTPPTDYSGSMLDLHESLFWPSFHKSSKSSAAIEDLYKAAFKSLNKAKFKEHKTLYSGDFLHLLEDWNFEHPIPWKTTTWEKVKPWEKAQTPLELAMSKSAKFTFGSKDNTESSNFFGPKPTERNLLLSETAKGAITLDPSTGAKQSSIHDAVKYALVDI